MHVQLLKNYYFPIKTFEFTDYFHINLIELIRKEKTIVFSKKKRHYLIVNLFFTMHFSSIMKNDIYKKKISLRKGLYFYFSSSDYSELLHILHLHAIIVYKSQHN